MRERDRSLMSIHTEKPNPRLSTKPVTTPENATPRWCRSSRRRRLRPTDAALAGVAAMPWCTTATVARRRRRGGAAETPSTQHTHGVGWRKDSKLLTRTQRRRHERTEELSIVSILYFLRLQRRNSRRPDGLERLARLPQLVALRLDEVVCLLRVLVEGLLDLVEFALLRLGLRSSSIDVLL